MMLAKSISFATTPVVPIRPRKCKEKLARFAVRPNGPSLMVAIFGQHATDSKQMKAVLKTMRSLAH